jgi:hypothetical protein
MQDGAIVYNWKEYFDELEEGDIVFTYFTGPGVSKGIYAVTRVVGITEDGKVRGMVLRYSDESPIVPEADFEKYESQIINRPYGSAYVIPPFLQIDFESLRQRLAVSEVTTEGALLCHSCAKDKKFYCSACPLLDPNVLIKWNNEVQLGIPGLEGIASAFWVRPRQASWMKVTIATRPFYAFKAGSQIYAGPFAHAITLVIQANPVFGNRKFDYILGIPLSPEKATRGEFDRVSKLCEYLGMESGIPYLQGGLKLNKPISRVAYKRRALNTFPQDYHDALSLSAPDLSNQTVLLVDDVITNGLTLSVTAGFLKERCPGAKFYGATVGIMGVRGNMSQMAMNRYRFHPPSAT